MAFAIITPHPFPMCFLTLRGFRLDEGQKFRIRRQSANVVSGSFHATRPHPLCSFEQFPP